MTTETLDVRVYEKGKRQNRDDHEVYSVKIMSKADEDPTYEVTSAPLRNVVVVSSEMRRKIGFYRDRDWRRMDTYEAAAATVLFCKTDAKAKKKRAAAYKQNEPEKTIAKVVHNSKLDRGLVSCKHGGPVGYNEGTRTELDKLFHEHFGNDADYGGNGSAKARKTLEEGGDMEKKEADFVSDKQGIV